MEKVWLKNYDYFVPETIRYPRIPLYQVLEMAACATRTTWPRSSSTRR